MASVAAPQQMRLGARLDFFDQLGIDYEVGADAALTWPTADELAGLVSQWHVFEGVRVFTRVRPGRVVRANGSVALPFDPDEALRNLYSEAYRRDRGRRFAARAYYAARPLLPRAVQLALRRSFARAQGLPAFPSWPVETAADDLAQLLLGLAGEAVGTAVTPAPTWPDGRSWALVLTHDVETGAGVEAVERVRRLEDELGFRSSWNFVPERYETPEELVSSLVQGGHEIGVHGLRHDGRDLASLRLLRRRLPGMRAAAQRWGAVGFRAPATQRRWEWMPLLGFEYDTSYPDTDPYEPQPGGCCTWLPFFNGDLVELPITVPQDHTVFEILGHQDETLWVEKIEFLRRRGGMALVLTHPDYLGDGSPALAAYERLLVRYRDDETAWRALPRDVAAWWRRRVGR